MLATLVNPSYVAGSNVGNGNGRISNGTASDIQDTNSRPRNRSANEKSDGCVEMVDGHITVDAHKAVKIFLR